MSTQYEVEHNVQSTGTSGQQRGRQVDMSTFTSHLHQISTTAGSSSSAEPHNNPHATPTPVDLAALFRLLQDQMGTLATTAPNPENRELLWELFRSLEEDIANPPTQIQGLSQTYVDALDRVPREKLKKDDTCPICAERYVDDKYCLVVQLPCHHSHRFDLECVAPWLLSKGTCPLCRKDLTKKKEVVVKDDEDDDENYGGLYA